MVEGGRGWIGEMKGGGTACAFGEKIRDGGNARVLCYYKREYMHIERRPNLSHSRSLSLLPSLHASFTPFPPSFLRQSPRAWKWRWP